MELTVPTTLSCLTSLQNTEKSATSKTCKSVYKDLRLCRSVCYCTGVLFHFCGTRNCVDEKSDTNLKKSLSYFNDVERLYCRLVKIKEVTDLRISSKNCGNVYNITNNVSVNGDDVTKNIVKIVFAVAIAIVIIVIAYRLLTVSDSVIQSILEKMLEMVFSGIEVLH